MCFVLLPGDPHATAEYVAQGADGVLLAGQGQVHAVRDAIPHPEDAGEEVLL